MVKLSHIDSEGKADMVDVSNKPQQKRYAKASGFIFLASETIELIKENLIKKGDVITVAEIAGIQAAKKCSDLIPLCHNIILSKINVKAKLTENGIKMTSEIISTGQTGVEMEALTSVSIALLTVYDMCKAVDKNMIISEIKLLEKIKNRPENE